MILAGQSLESILTVRIIGNMENKYYRRHIQYVRRIVDIDTLTIQSFKIINSCLGQFSSRHVQRLLSHQCWYDYLVIKYARVCLLLYRIVALIAFDQKHQFFSAHSLAEIIALLSVIDSINWTDAMTHTQHELPPMSDERNKIGDLDHMRSARKYGIVEIICCRSFPLLLVGVNQSETVKN